MKRPRRQTVVTAGRPPLLRSPMCWGALGPPPLSVAGGAAAEAAAPAERILLLLRDCCI